MNGQDRAKAAVEWLKVANVGTQADIAAREYARDLLRPIAAGTSGVLPLTLLKKYGYAKGNYSSTCIRCNQTKHDMAKRAICCLDCAMIAASQEGE